jgi:hypothetical protein
MVVWAVDVIALFGRAVVLSAILEKVIAFSSHCALKLCTMRIVGFFLIHNTFFWGGTGSSFQAIQEHCCSITLSFKRKRIFRACVDNKVDRKDVYAACV